VSSVAELDEKLRTAGRPAMLDFYADWCSRARRWRSSRIGRTRAQELENVLLLQADVTGGERGGPRIAEALLAVRAARHHFFDADGREIPGLRVIGYSRRSASSRRLPLPLAIDHGDRGARSRRGGDELSRARFHLTPRGFHSIGSQNHCIMFASTYVELLAAPVAHPWLDYYRRFLREQGEGLAPSRSRRTMRMPHMRTTRARRAAKSPMDLSRPVEGGVARFGWWQMTAPGVFVCQHLTRELVWRREWQAHATRQPSWSVFRLRPSDRSMGCRSPLRGNEARRCISAACRGAHEAHGVRLLPA